MLIPRRLKQGVERLLGYSRADPVDVKIAQVLALIARPNSNCIDVGAHRGAILSHIVRIAPLGRHVAFEPLPRFAASLRRKFPQVAVHE